MNKVSHNIIFGHKIPDTDSVCSAIALSNLKNKLNQKSKPYVLGKINRETEFVLNYFGVKCPEILNNVKIQICDLDYEKSPSIRDDISVNSAYNFMNKNKIRTLAITDNDGNFSGIVTMKDIAMSLINTDQKLLNTSYENILEALNGKEVVKSKDTIDGEIIVAAFEEKTLRQNESLNNRSIVIVGDRYDVIKYAIDIKIELIIITGGLDIQEELIKDAICNNVNIITTPYKTYYTAKNISLSKYVKEIMKSKKLITFDNSDYLDYCKEVVEMSLHSKFPILEDNKKYLGALSRNDLINPRKKKVILVDHNERGQSAEGIEEAEILEVIDHHKIAAMTTSEPISFRNIPVGSTNTIIYSMYREHGIEIDKETAGLMLSGIISDTMILKSPTTTGQDRNAVDNLCEIAEIDLQTYSMNMFKAGTSLEGKSVEEIFYQDFKEFALESKNVGISQVFTLNIRDIAQKSSEYIDLINKKTHEDRYEYVIMAVTDIVKEGSYIYYTSGKEKLTELVFDIEGAYQGMYVDMCVSRKKQIVPNVIYGLKGLKK